MASTISGNNGLVAPTGAVYNGIQSGTTVASTSGTSIDFTGIPSWVKRITVMLQGVSTNSTSSVIIQLGVGGVATTSGYVGSSTRIGASTIATSAYAGDGFAINVLNVAASLLTGNVVLTLQTGNTWTASGVVAGTSTNLQHTTAGYVTLSGTANLVRITSATPDTFDAGSINILYE